MPKGKTFFGGIISLLALIITMIYGIYSFYIIIARKIPNISYIEYNVAENSLKYNIDKNFLIVIGIPCDPMFGIELFNSYASYKYLVANSIERKYLDFNLRECIFDDVKDVMSSDKFQNFINGSTFGSYHFYCLDGSDLPNSEETLIQGKITSDDWSIFSVNFFTNEKIFDLNNKTLIDYYKKILSQQAIAIMIKDNSIDPENYKNPIGKYLQENLLPFSLETTNGYNVYLKQWIIETDKGIFINNYNTEKVIGVEDNGYLEYYINDEDIGPMAYFNINAGDNVIKYSRTYKKIPDLLSDIFGIWSTFITIASFIVSPCSEFKIKSSFIKKLFEFDFNSNERKIINLKNKPITIIKRKSFKKNKIRKKKSSDLNYYNEQKNAPKDLIKSIKSRASFKKQISNNSVKLNLFSEDLNDSRKELINQKINTLISKIGDSLIKNEDKKNIDINQGKLAPKEFRDILFKSNLFKEQINGQNKNIIHKGYEDLNFSKKEKFIVSSILFDCSRECCFKGNKTLELYEKLCNNIDNFLEMSNIISQLEEIEKLKKILFTPEQLSMFKYISGNIFDINGNNININRINEEIENQNYWKRITLKCFEYKEKIEKKLNEGKNKDENNNEIFSSFIDKNLLELLDNRIKNFEFN